MQYCCRFKVRLRSRQNSRRSTSYKHSKSVQIREDQIILAVCSSSVRIWADFVGLFPIWASFRGCPLRSGGEWPVLRGFGTNSAGAQAPWTGSVGSKSTPERPLAPSAPLPTPPFLPKSPKDPPKSAQIRTPLDQTAKILIIRGSCND